LLEFNIKRFERVIIDGKKITISLPQELIKKLEEIKDKTGISISA